MKKKKEKTYTLTFKGFMSIEYEFDLEKTDRFLDRLELWLRRQDKNALMFNSESGEFDTVKIYRG
jgi:hypothetical protein